MQYWYFLTDGTIQFEVKLTGIVSTSPLYPEEEAAGGSKGSCYVRCFVCCWRPRTLLCALLCMLMAC